MGNFGFLEIMIILFVVILLFGARRIPELAKGLGEGIRNFKTGMRGDEKEKLEERREETPRSA